MFSEQYHSMMCSNRALEKILSHFSNVVIKNSQNHRHFQDFILDVCDGNGLKKETKYVVKKSLDVFVLKFAQASPQQIQFAALNFLFMAVKFMEDSQIYSIINLKWFYQSSELNSDLYTIEDFIQFEIQISKFPEFDLNFTTPWDYLGLYRSAFLLDDKNVKKIQNVIDYSLTIPELMFASAEELFFGAMLMIGQKKNLQREWILEQTFSKERAQKTCSIIKQQYQREIHSIERVTNHK